MAVMPHRVLTKFRIAEDRGVQRTYRPGEVITRPETIKIAHAQGWSEPAPDAKAKPAPQNKSKGAAPENKAAG
jgi:hypothetical protein